MVFFLLPFFIKGYDSIGLGGFAGLLTESENNFYWHVGPTVAWYTIGQTTMIDTRNNLETLRNNKPKAVFGLLFDVGRPVAEIVKKKSGKVFPVVCGVRFSYSRRRNAVRHDYTEPRETTTHFQARHNVLDWRVAPYLGMQYASDRITLAGSMGVGIGYKMMDHFKLYQKDPFGFAGQETRSSSLAFVGDFACSLQVKLVRDAFMRLEYGFAMGNVNYKRKVYISDPDESTGVDDFIDQGFVTDVDSIFLPSRPKIPVKCHRLAWSIGFNF